MDGMQMMLRSFGVDPEKIKGSLMDAKQSIETELRNIHIKLDAIIARLDALENLPQRNGELTPPWDEEMYALDKRAKKGENGSISNNTSQRGNS